MKKLMLLGGSRYLIPVIETAHKLNIYVITCDYLPDNDAHKYADEYRNISIIDKEAVLAAAEEMKIDGIMSFACDPGVVTAAYVAEKMGLPFQGSYEAVSILQDKGKFRQFLTDNGFRCPRAKRYENVDDPFKDIDFFNWPVMVKPTDSAGSKGVTRVDKPEKLKEAIEVAINGAHNGAFIIEEFLTFEGYHSSADPFTINGKLEFVTYSDQLFDKEAENPYTPAYIIWPSSMKQEYQEELSRETQRLMDLLGMRTGIYNIETCVAAGKPYIMEVSPRGGGCKIAELQQRAFGVDLIENEVKKAVGLPVENVKQTNCEGYWCEMVVHARPGQSGILKKISIDPEIERKYVKVIDLSAKAGDYVKPFTGANMALGDIFLRFDSREELDEIMSKASEWLQIELCKTNDKMGDFRRNDCLEAEGYRTSEVHSENRIKDAMLQVDSAFEESIVNSDDFSKLLKKICENAFFIIIEHDSEICSYAAMYANDMESREAYLTLIAVKKEYQKNHIGTYMMEKLIDYARTCGMKKIKLEVKKMNTCAIEFYRKMGFSYLSECSAESDYYMRVL